MKFDQVREKLRISCLPLATHTHSLFDAITRCNCLVPYQPMWICIILLLYKITIIIKPKTESCAGALLAMLFRAIVLERDMSMMLHENVLAHIYVINTIIFIDIKTTIDYSCGALIPYGLLIDWTRSDVSSALWLWRMSKLFSNSEVMKKNFHGSVGRLWKKENRVLYAINL